MSEEGLDISNLELTEPLFDSVKFYVSGEVENKVIELLKCGGAERMNYFSDYVTHLICGRDAEDTDLSDANEVYEIPAVTPKWIYMCVTLKRLVNTKPYLYGGSKLFSNLVFCLSKPENDLNVLWALISYNGGKVQLNLDNKCTHLVTTNTTTLKYMKAFSLGPERITVITPDWIMESIRNGAFVQADLYHPKLIQWPKIVKHESTTAITGFEPPEQTELEEKAPETSAADSTQALLERLKQRMPWNQPQSADIVPPNVVAPSFTQTTKLPNLDQMRMFNNQMNTSSQSSAPFQTAPQQTQSNASQPGQQVPRSVVHHTAQPQQQQQQQQQFVHQQQSNSFQQMNLQPQNQQLNLNRLIGQQQQQHRPVLQGNMAQQLNKLNQMNQQNQFAQQLLQRNHMGQLNQQIIQNPMNSSAQTATPQMAQQSSIQQVQISTQNQQNIIQRAALGQMNKGIGLQQLQHGQQVIQQHIQQLGNRQHINPNQLLQNQQLTHQQINQNPQLVQQQLSQLPQQQQQQLIQQQNQQQLTQQVVQTQQMTQQQIPQPPLRQSPQQYTGMMQQQTIEQQQMLNQNQQQQMALSQNKIVQNQFQQQQNVPNLTLQNQQTGLSVQQQQFVTSPAVNQQQFVAAPNQQHFIQQNQQGFTQQQQQFVQQQNQQQMLNQQQQQQQQQQVIGQQQILNHQQMLLNQQQQQPTVQQQQSFNQTVNQQSQGAPPPQQRPLWQQQQQQQLGVRHPAGIVQQNQAPRIQWPPNQHRQFIQLDAQTHQQLQQMAPEQRAAFVAKLQRQRHNLLVQQKQQIQMQQQRGGHILIRGAVPSGLNPQQQMQWLQQQAKQQGVVLQSNVQQTVPQGALPAQGTLPHTPGLSPIQQHNPSQFSEQNQQQLQMQRQFRLQQLQLQREQAKNVQMQPALAQGNVVRPMGQPQPAEVPSPNAESNVPPQHPLVVNAKTKTALANMLSIRLQSGGSSMGPGPENITEPSAAGTLRLMTAQHNAALNSGTRPQDLLTLQQQRRVINPPTPADLVRPSGAPVVPLSPQGEPPKLQYSPRPAVPLQHRPGTFYGHNPNLKLPPDLFLLGCIFVVVELERYLEESLPGWQQKIEKHGGEIEPQYCSRVTHVLCETQRHGVVMQALRDYKRCVTLYWLSDVINRKQVLPPWTALHLPTMYLDTTPASKHLISLSGFAGTERNRIKHMIKYTGASLTTYFSKHNTLLVAAKAEGSKYMHAKKWGTPVVSVQWLTDVMLGNFSALNQTEHVKYQQFCNPPNFSFDPLLVPNLMQAWKMPINISQESYERVKRSPSPVLMPKVKKMKTEHCTDENDNDMPLVTHKILFSRCADVDQLKNIVKQLGGSTAASHTDCTHLVMPNLSRTNKLLFCIARGVQIVPESWLHDSQTAGKFLDEINYTFDTKDFNSEYKCDIMQTLATKNRNKLLEGRFFYVTPSVFPNKKVLVELIQSCGGIVERTRRTLSQIEATNVNSPYSYVIITHEKDLHLVADLLRNKKEKIRVVCNVELILSGILKQTFEVEPYAVKIL